MTYPIANGPRRQNATGQGRRTFTAPKITVHKIKAPEITVPKITAPEITVPKITAPEITVPKSQCPKPPAGWKIGLRPMLWRGVLSGASMAA